MLANVREYLHKNANFTTTYSGKLCQESLKQIGYIRFVKIP